MKKGLAIHGGLLVVALLFAYQTWTRDKTVDKERPTFVLWKGAPKDVTALDYDADKKTVRVERRKDDEGGYLWGVVSRTITKRPPKPPKPPKPPVSEAGKDGGPEPAEPEPTIEVKKREFPIGESGDKLLETLAPLHAIRDLGELSDERRTDYGLDDTKTQLTVHFAGEPRSLLIGDRVYGGSDRYVIDSGTGHAYILSGEVFRPLEGADAALRQRKVIPFNKDDIKQVLVKTGGKEKTLVRYKKPADKPGAREKVTWADAITPDRPDQTLANFMDRVEKLAPMEFLPEKTTEGMTEIATLIYTSIADGKTGDIKLYKEAGDRPGKFEYFLRSQRTRVLAKVNRMSAERVDKDLEQIVAPPAKPTGGARSGGAATPQAPKSPAPAAPMSPASGPPMTPTPKAPKGTPPAPKPPIKVSPKAAPRPPIKVSPKTAPKTAPKPPKPPKPADNEKPAQP